MKRSVDPRLVRERFLAGGPGRVEFMGVVTGVAGVPVDEFHRFRTAHMKSFRPERED